MPCVGVRKQDGIGQVLAQSVRVGYGNHLVVDTIHDEHRMADGLELCESVALECLPLPERRNLRVRDIRARDGVAILFALQEPLDERLGRRLARGRRPEEDLLQDVVPLVRRVLNVFREVRLFDVHDVLAAARGGPHQDHSPKNRRPILHHLKRDHPAEGVPEDVAPFDSKRLQKGQWMSRHFGNRRRDVAARAPHACVVEENDLPSGGERIGHRGIPVVQRPREVLK